jgi:hypothetical protein
LLLFLNVSKGKKKIFLKQLLKSFLFEKFFLDLGWMTGLPLEEGRKSRRAGTF